MVGLLRSYFRCGFLRKPWHSWHFVLTFSLLWRFVLCSIELMFRVSLSCVWCQCLPYLLYLLCDCQRFQDLVHVLWRKTYPSQRSSALDLPRKCKMAQTVTRVRRDELCWVMGFYEKKPNYLKMILGSVSYYVSLCC